MIMGLICFYVFYLGYRAVSYDNSRFKLYLAAETPLTLFYCYVFYYNTPSYNGVLRIIEFWKAKMTSTAIAMIIEEAFLFLSIFMRLSCLYRGLTWEK
jgi:hypothetical protein